MLVCKHTTRDMRIGVLQKALIKFDHVLRPDTIRREREREPKVDETAAIWKNHSRAILFPRCKFRIFLVPESAPGTRLVTPLPRTGEV